MSDRAGGEAHRERAERSELPRSPATPAATPRHPVLRLQHDVGNAAVQRALAAARASAGEPLTAGVRTPYEAAYGESFADVHVHADAPAARAAAELNATAFTRGRDVYFGEGMLDPSTRSGRTLLAHELAHTLQSDPAEATAATVVPGRDSRELEAAAAASSFERTGMVGAVVQRASPGELLRQDAPPAGYREGVDPDVPLIEEEHVPEEEQQAFEQAGVGPLRYRLILAQPDVFLVPITSTREQIAAGLFGDAARTGDFDFVPSEGEVAGGEMPEIGVRVRTFSALSERPAMLIRAMLDVVLRRDVAWVVAKLNETSIDDADEWALVGRTLDWSQRSDMTDPSGVSLFDRYLDGLAAETITTSDWYTLGFTETTHTALERLLVETAEKSDQIRKAIELRSASRAGTTGYTLTATADGELPPMEVIGRFYWSTGSGAGSGIQLRVLETIANEPTRERAEIATRNAPFLGIRAVIPGGDGHWYGYSVLLPTLDPLVLDPSDDPHGRYYWFFPGTLLIRADEFQQDFPALGPEEREFRRTLLDEALMLASADNIRPLLGLDFDVLAQATFDERIAIFNLVLSAQRTWDDAINLLTRVILSVPDSEFQQFERVFSTAGLAERILGRAESAKIALGHAFTTKTLMAIPLGVESLARMETLQIGKDPDDVHHMLDVGVSTAESRVVAPGDWRAEQAAQVGAEPAIPGEEAGPIQRPVLRFQPVQYEVGITTRHEVGARTRAFLPTELVRLEIIGTPPQTRIATAFEVAAIASVPNTAMLWEAGFYAVNAYLYARAGMGITRAFGPAFAGGLATGGLGAALRASAQVAATEAGRQALRAFLWDVLILGSMSIVDHYRDELRQSEAGRLFLDLYDTAMTILIVRDVYRLASSGILTELATRGVAMLRAVGAAARTGLLRVIDDLQALAVAWQRLRTAGELVEVVTAEGFRTFRPRSEGTFRQFFLSARAELTAARVVAGFGGSARTVASRVFQRLEQLAARNEEVARAFGAIARRAEGMTATAAEEYLLAVERLLGPQQRRSLEAVAGFLRASARAAQPAAYLRLVDDLLARSVSSDALAELGRKAGAGQLDLEWLSTTTLTDEELSFLGADPRTPWKLFQSAALHPEEMQWVTPRLRGIAAEMVADETRRLVPGHRITGRQVRMGTSDIDFGLVSTDGAGRRRGLEVKGWTRGTWREALEAFERAARGRRLSAGERKAMEKIEHMLGQLQDARAATRQPPVLVVTDDLGPVRAQLDDVLRANAPRGTEVQTISEDAIKNLRRRLSEALGLE